MLLSSKSGYETSCWQESLIGDYDNVFINPLQRASRPSLIDITEHLQTEPTGSIPLESITELAGHYILPDFNDDSDCRAKASVLLLYSLNQSIMNPISPALYATL